MLPSVYRRIIEKINQFLKPDAALMLEIGYAQGKAIKELLEQAIVFTEINVEKDLHNNGRFATAKRTPNKKQYRSQPAVTVSSSFAPKKFSEKFEIFTISKCLSF